MRISSGIFSCGICNDVREKQGIEKLEFLRYHKFVYHLAGNEHQTVARDNFEEKNRLDKKILGDDDRYVIVENRKYGHTEGSLFSVGAWISRFGVVTDLIGFSGDGIVVATIQFLGTANEVYAQIDKFCFAQNYK